MFASWPGIYSVPAALCIARIRRTLLALAPPALLRLAHAGIRRAGLREVVRELPRLAFLLTAVRVR
jgi:hypothetical protein